MTEDFVRHLHGYAERKEEFGTKGMTADFATDVLATCGFGVEAQAFTNPNGPFRASVS